VVVAPAPTQTSLEVRAGIVKKYKATMKEKPKGSWSGDVVPPIATGEPFGGGSEVAAALAVAEAAGLLALILTAREGLVTALHALQCAVCAAAGDARTSRDAAVRGDGPNWYDWDLADPTLPGYELNKGVLDAMVAVQQCPAIKDLDRHVGELTSGTFLAIPVGEEGGGVGSSSRAIVQLNTAPVQDFLRVAPLAGKDFGKIPMAEWSANMKAEIEAAVGLLKSGAFGDPDSFFKVGRADFAMIKGTNEKHKKINPTYYLIVLGINRHAEFNALGVQVAAKANCTFSPGPIKTKDRVAAKCAPGGDYFSYDAAMQPDCMRVLDIVRGTMVVTTQAMMFNTHAAAVEVFGEAAVVKDRRTKVQHDLLLIFKVRGMWVELQLHYGQLLPLKSLMHAVFELQRLTTDECVAASGLRTVMEIPDPEFGQSAADCKMLLHI